MGVALFLSTVTNKVDKKGRCSVPSAFRSAITGAGFERVALYPAVGVPCLEGADPAHFERIAKRIFQSGNLLTPSKSGLARRILGQVVELSWDAEGRIVLPQKLRDYAGISSEARIIGLGPVFQIWDPARQLEFDSQNDDEFAAEIEALGSYYGAEEPI